MHLFLCGIWFFVVPEYPIGADSLCGPPPAYSRPWQIGEASPHYFHDGAVSAFGHSVELMERGQFLRAESYRRFARCFFALALTHSRAEFGEYHNTTANSYFNIALTHWHSEEYSDMLAMLKRSLRIRLHVLNGEPHTSIAQTYELIGSVVLLTPRPWILYYMFYRDSVGAVWTQAAKIWRQLGIRESGCANRECIRRMLVPFPL